MHSTPPDADEDRALRDQMADDDRDKAIAHMEANCPGPNGEGEPDTLMGLPGPTDARSDWLQRLDVAVRAYYGNAAEVAHTYVRDKPGVLTAMYVNVQGHVKVHAETTTATIQRMVLDLEAEVAQGHTLPVLVEPEPSVHGIRALMRAVQEVHPGRVEAIRTTRLGEFTTHDSVAVTVDQETKAELEHLSWEGIEALLALWESARRGNLPR